MRISYWSSDVCSSDLGYIGVEPQDSSDLIEKSSREGFEENGAFLRLRRIVQRLFAEAVEPRRQTFRKSAGLDRKSVGGGKSVSGMIDLDGGRTIKKKIKEI